jgi:hypothetical protein
MAGAAGQLGTLLSEKAADFKVISQRHDANGPMQDRALEIVRQFIIDRKIIVFGGLAIDYALRLRGGSIYPDAQRPDFDTLSPNSVEDAYDLADALHRAGFSNVGAIRAIHVQTMNVRVNFIPLLDIGFTPPEVFARLPTLDYGGIRILHPDFQRLDMHLAFCFPFSGAPREDIFHRWKKDLKRFNILQTTYPVRAGSLTVAGGGASAAPPQLNVGYADLADKIFALHGIAAFGLLLAALRELREIVGLPNEADNRWPIVSTTVNRDFIKVSLPPNHAKAFEYVAIATPHPDGICDARKQEGCDVVWYEPYMDAKPETAVITSEGTPLHVFSTRGRQLAVVAMEVNEKHILIVSPQYLLLHFLLEAHLARDEAVRSILTQYYLWTLDILHEGASIIDKELTPKVAAKDFDRGKFINSSPFGLTTRVMGDVNHNEAYMIRIATMAQDIGDAPPASLELEANVKKVLDGLPPRGYYPPKTRPPKFDYTRNVLFQRSGRAITSSLRAEH